MIEKKNSNIHLALVHFPVYNKHYEIVTSSVTTLDVHDISRICKTYDINSFYVVTPLRTQQLLVDRMLKHWLAGFGAEYNPTRREALMQTVVQPNIEKVVEDVQKLRGKKPQTVVTDARTFPNSVDYPTMREKIASDCEFLLIFGTAWGLEKGIIRRADHILMPIDGKNGYNHLPVRSAIAIILDRLLT
tara:strand:- start:1272 stop:1838 length:567 start_codon:yes stop_codon:yes gene_type:complete